MLPLAVKLFTKPPRHSQSVSHNLTKLKCCSLVIAQSFDETKKNIIMVYIYTFQMKRLIINGLFLADKSFICAWLIISVVVFNNKKRFLLRVEQKQTITITRITRFQTRKENEEENEQNH